MVTLKNPTDNDVAVQYLGTTYALAPQDSGTFTDDVAEFWLGVHEFLSVVDGPATEPIVAPKIEEKTEEIKKEEAPIAPESIEILEVPMPAPVAAPAPKATPVAPAPKKITK